MRDAKRHEAMDARRRPTRLACLVLMVVASALAALVHKARQNSQEEWFLYDTEMETVPGDLSAKQVRFPIQEDHADEKGRKNVWKSDQNGTDLPAPTEYPEPEPNGAIQDQDEELFEERQAGGKVSPSRGSTDGKLHDMNAMSQNPHHRFLMFFSGHQGSSAMMDVIGQIPGVFVPGFEPLDNPNGPVKESFLSTQQKMEFLRAIMNMPESASNFDEWKAKVLPNQYIRVDRQRIQTYEQIANSTVAGFKMRPYTLDGDSMPAMINLNPDDVKKMLDEHQVNVVLSWRSNIVKSALSWYRARVLGKRQCFRHNDELCKKNDERAQTASEINLEDFDKWIKYVEKTNDQLMKAVSYFRRPTMTINYEDFEVHPIKSIAQVLEFVGVPAEERTDERIEFAISQTSFHKVGSNAWMDMVSNFREFCEHFRNTIYWPNLGLESCEEADQNAADRGFRLSTDAAKDMDLLPGSRYCLLKDVVASGWVGMDGEYDPHLGPCDIRIVKARAQALKKARMGEGKILFKHMHKAGGSTLCNVARENVRAEKAPIPGGNDGWDTNCVPQLAYQKNGVPLATAEAEKEGAWYGGVCYASHLSVAAQRALGTTHKDLDFIASEGPMPDTLALDLPVAWITMLRDPLDRTLSSYRWWQFLADRFRDKPKVRTALCDAYQSPHPDASLQEWLEVYPDNWMVRVLCGRAVLMDKSIRITEKHLTAAKARLNQFSLVMVLEDMESSMKLLSSTLDWADVDAEALRANVMSNSSARIALADEPEILEELVSRNKMDLELYKYGQELFRRQLKFSNL